MLLTGISSYGNLSIVTSKIQSEQMEFIFTGRTWCAWGSGVVKK